MGNFARSLGLARVTPVVSHLGYFCGVRYEGNFSVWVDRVEN